MASRKDSNPRAEGLPFGAIEGVDTSTAVDGSKPKKKRAAKKAAADDEPAKKRAVPGKKATKKATKKVAGTKTAGKAKTAKTAKTAKAGKATKAAKTSKTTKAKTATQAGEAKTSKATKAKVSTSRSKSKEETAAASGPSDVRASVPERAERATGVERGSDNGAAPVAEGERRLSRADRDGRPDRPDRPDRDGRDGRDGQDRDDREGGRRKRWQKRRRRRNRRGGGGGGGGQPDAQGQSKPSQQGGGTATQAAPGEKREAIGMFLLEKANHGRLRDPERMLLPTKHDVHVPPRLVQRYQLRDGAMVRGPVGRGQGKNKYDLLDVAEVDGRDPKELTNLPRFKGLTSIDPDFHYAVGDGADDCSLRIVDLICPVGRGQRGLIVAPPRSGKTILLQKFAQAVEQIYPEVHLMVLLVDERPEEATEWQRTVKNGQVFVSTNDELHRNHVELCESVWRRCKRLVELGEDVILVMDSITRMGRAYNNVHGNSGKTMSGGLDTRALERPKQFFGSARNTETAGSLTILGTCLIETGSMMDKVIFEEFKGTGNMELVLSRKLADRRIFPAIDIEKSGTRKEEKLISSRRLKLITTLRRVLTRMHFAEAMELLITKLDDVEKTDDFLSRFEIDPEAE